MAYWARKAQFNGHTFDSGAEATYYQRLLAMEQAGEITGLEVHPRWELAPGVRIAGERRKRPAMHYTADFAYTDTDGCLHVVDVKPANGHMTAAFRMRQHLMRTVHGIDVEIVRTENRRGRR